jgi:hypothetical protein
VPCEQAETLNNLGELLIRSSDSRHAPVHYRRRTVIDCVTAAHAERRDLDDWRSAETGSCGGPDSGCRGRFAAGQRVRVGVRYQADDAAWRMHPRKMAETCRLAAAWRPP